MKRGGHEATRWRCSIYASFLAPGGRRELKFICLPQQRQGLGTRWYLSLLWGKVSELQGLRTCLSLGDTELILLVKFLSPESGEGSLWGEHTTSWTPRQGSLPARRALRTQGGPEKAGATCTLFCPWHFLCRRELQTVGRGVC